MHNTIPKIKLSLKNKSTKIKLKLKSELNFFKPCDEELKETLICTHTYQQACVHKPYKIRLEMIKNNEKYKLLKYDLIDIKCETYKPCQNLQCKRCYEKSFISAPNRILMLWSLENIISPRDIWLTDAHDRWFNCPNNCGHKFLRTPKDILRPPGSRKANNSNKLISTDWMPKCPGPLCENQYLCHDNECSICKDASALNIITKDIWSDRKINNIRLNGSLYPRDVHKSSKISIWYDCIKCNHTYLMSLNEVNRGKRCPYCCIGKRKYCLINNCQWCHQHSILGGKKCDEYSDINIEPAHLVSKNANKKFYFECFNCKHTYDSRPYNNTGCPYCSNPPKQLCEDLECDQCFRKSFMSHEKHIYLTSENKSFSRQIFKNSNDKYEFKCEECNNSFKTSLRNVCIGKWCPFCKNKTELKLLNWLIKNFNYIFTKEARVDWCISSSSGHFMPFDYLCEELKLIIELDGNAHFQQVWNWENHDSRQDKDIYKMKNALNNGYSIIRIIQEDVYYDRNNWEIKLKEGIKKYDTPEVLYIDNQQNRYKVYQQKMLD